MYRDGGDLGVAGVQLPPHVRHDVVVLQPDEEAPVPAAGLAQQHLLVEGEGLEGVEGVEGDLWLVEAVCGEEEAGQQLS